jgi:hypothetical protein
VVVRVNTDLSGLVQQQQAAAGGAQKAAANQEAKKPASESSAAATAEIRAAVASENKAAGRSEPIDADTATALASALRNQIKANPNAALGAHDLSADRTRDLLS